MFYKSIKFHFYADDIQLYVYLSPDRTSADFINSEECLSDVQNWMGSNKLKLIPGKTEFFLFGCSAQTAQLSGCFPIDILGSEFIMSHL